MLVALVVLNSAAGNAQTCEKFGQVGSALNIDLEWVMQGYQIGFQGFFVELLGFSESLVRFLPQARLVKSSFRKSFTEPPFPSEKFLTQELFAEEEASVRRLASSEQSKHSQPFPTCLGAKQIDAIECSGSGMIEKDYVYYDGELSKHVAPNVSSALECCNACISNALCLSWSFAENFCSLKGKMDLAGGPFPGGASGRMITRVATTSVAADGTTNASAAPAASVLVKRRAPVPRVVVYHGTTCIHRNHSVSLGGRDINTILIGRYMLERPYIAGGYNLDEYAVMHCAARMDEIWVPTEWHRDVFQRLFAQQGSLSSMPLISVIPEAVNTELFDPNFRITGPRRSIVGEDRLYLVDGTRLNGTRDEGSHSNRIVVRKNCVVKDNGRVQCDDHQRFEFLSIFKWEYRKGWDVMLDAFWAAFTTEDDVVLRIRSYVPHTSGGDRNITRVIEAYAARVHGKALSELAAVVWETGLGGFTVPNASGAESPVDALHSPEDVAEERLPPGTTEKEPETHLTREDMRSLLASTNAFVLATRGEGWGLPIAEAMAMALPVIVTNHSGPAAYATAENAYLIPVLGELDAQSFAKPDATQLAQLYRQVVVDSSVEAGYAAQEKGLRARETMKEFSADSIVCKMNERLRYHASMRGWQLP